MTALDLVIDVTDAAAIGEPASVALTVTVPDPEMLPTVPVVCFAKPGGGYSKGYFTADLPGPARGSQAAWHAARGWIFVAVDHLGVGGSSLHPPEVLDYTTLAATAMAAEAEVLDRLANGTLASGFPPIADPIQIGIGQSMGGCMTIVQQGRHHCYDGIGVLGYSAVHTHPPVRPGEVPIVQPWLPRDRLLKRPLTVVNQAAVSRYRARQAAAPPSAGEHPMLWGFHYDDVDRATALADLERFFFIHDPVKFREQRCPPWGSITTPGAVSASCLTPGAVAPEAAAVTVPVLVAMGERDVCADVPGEARAYLSSNSVDLFVCPRMAHMHNFASTRALLWERIALFADWAGATRGAVRGARVAG